MHLERVPFRTVAVSCRERLALSVQDPLHVVPELAAILDAAEMAVERRRGTGEVVETSAERLGLSVSSAPIERPNRCVSSRASPSTSLPGADRSEWH